MAIISVSGTKSLLGFVRCSILGPLLLNIFINDLFLFANKSDIGYADDNTLYSANKNSHTISDLLGIHWRFLTISKTSSKSVSSNVFWYAKVYKFWKFIQYIIHREKHIKEYRCKFKTDKITYSKSVFCRTTYYVTKNKPSVNPSLTLKPWQNSSNRSSIHSFKSKVKNPLQIFEFYRLR